MLSRQDYEDFGIWRSGWRNYSEWNRELVNLITSISLQKNILVSSTTHRRKMKGIKGAPAICHTPFSPKQDPKMAGLVTSPKQKDFGQLDKQKDFIG